MSCLVTDAVSGPCTRCGEYVTRMHLDDAAGMFCARCCPKHGNSGHLPAGPVKTLEGEQIGMFTQAGDLE